jgi:NADPH-dependent 2,4-dienoyl-CoA reductase/sulfur reductase-like enzyme
VTKLVIVGGGDAGITAAVRARKVDPAAQIDLLLADRWPNYSICGLPYLLSGEVPRVEDLAHRTRRNIEAAGVNLHLEHRVETIDARERRVCARATKGGQQFSYDALVIGTGALPQRPSIDGLDEDGVHQLHTVDDALELAERLWTAGTRRAVVVGAGYIGLEMADALRHRELDVAVVERLPEVMPTVDPQMGQLVRRTLQAGGVEVLTDTTVSRIAREGDALQVHTDRRTLDADFVLVVTGVRPDVELGVQAGARLGAADALAVDQRMWTGVPGVWAAGDCVHTHHQLLAEPAYLPLGTTAHKQGRVAGENAVGGSRRFVGVLGTQVVKILDLAVAATGLRDDSALRNGYRPRTEQVVVPDHTRYYPGAVDLTIRLTADERDGRLLGAQIAGGLSGQIAKRIDTIATALHNRMVAGRGGKQSSASRLSRLIPVSALAATGIRSGLGRTRSVLGRPRARNPASSA